MAYGLCSGHRQRQLKHGDPAFDYFAVVRVDRAAPCKIVGCEKAIGKYGNNGMCRYHARAVQRARRPAHYRAKVNARRSRERAATPSWADLAAIERIYLNCPAGHEVDHIVPLQSPEVCGLHVPYNLQYLPMPENRRKSNRLNPGL